MKLTDVKILNLREKQEYLEEVTRWIWEEWSKEHGASLEDNIYRSLHSIKKDCVPEMFVAEYQNNVIGVVSIWMNDLNARQDLFPWMATLYVKKEYRNQGVGKQLQLKCIEECQKMNYPSLYLITDHENYYEKMGWQFLEKAPLGDGCSTRIYEYKLKKENDF